LIEVPREKSSTICTQCDLFEAIAAGREAIAIDEKGERDDFRYARYLPYDMVLVNRSNSPIPDSHCIEFTNFGQFVISALNRPITLK
jgi:hypothetical protein